MIFLKKTDVQGVLFLALALFLTTSLVSYHPMDPSLNSLGQEPVENYCGTAGALFADLLYQGFGWGAWLFILFSLRCSFLAFCGKSKWLKTSYFAGALFVISACGLLSLFWPETRIFNNYILVGGFLGQLVQAGLLPILHKAGAFIVLASSILCCFTAISHRPIRFYLKSFLDLAGLIGAKTFDLSKKMFKAAFALIKRESAVELPPIVFHRGEPAEDTAPEEGAQPPSEIQDISFSPSGEETMLPLSTPKDTHFEKPHYSLLPEPPQNTPRLLSQEIESQTKKLVDKLAQFSITGEMVGVKSGPAVTLFEFRPADAVKVGKITGLADDLSMALSAESLRIIAPIPGRDVVGIEASNSSREMVFFRDMIKDSRFQSHPWRLPLIIGRSVDGSVNIQELAAMPHLMVAGSTGSGKSVFITSVLSALLMQHSPETLRLILIDPKQVDLTAFCDIPHLLFPPVTNIDKALSTLRWTIQEMEKRYRSLNEFHVRNLSGFNHAASALSEEEKARHEMTNDTKSPEQSYYYEPLPYITLVIEEFGDLMTSPKRIPIEQSIVRLAQMARACGIHLILAMQSPRKDVITGLIKTNIPGRISFKVSSKIDSRVILDESGAERLLAKGDMLFLAPHQAKIKRCHAPYISEEELDIIVNHWKAQGRPEYKNTEEAQALSSDFTPAAYEEGEDMEKYLEIKSYISSLKTISTSSLQRRFRLGYPRAARMMEKFEEEGLVGPASGSKPREVLHNK